MLKFLKKVYSYNSESEEPELASLEFVLEKFAHKELCTVLINKDGGLRLLDGDSLSGEELEFVLRKSKEIFGTLPIFVEKEKPAKEDIVIPTPEKI